VKLRVVRAGLWRVLALCHERGDCELLEFLDGLEQRHLKDRDRLLALFQRVADTGPTQLSDSLSHSLQGDIWESIQGNLRVLWFYDKGKVVVCSHALIKRGRKIPPGEIRLAQQRCNEYRRSTPVEIPDDEEA